MPNLHTKYVLITGCDKGFGLETAVRLDKIGVNVLGTCLTEQGARKLQSMASDRLKTFVMDVTYSQQIEDVFEQVKKLLPTGHGNLKPDVIITLTIVYVHSLNLVCHSHVNL